MFFSNFSSIFISFSIIFKFYPFIYSTFCVFLLFLKNLTAKKLKQKNTLALNLVIVPLIYKQSLLCSSHVNTNSISIKKTLI